MDRAQQIHNNRNNIRNQLKLLHVVEKAAEPPQQSEKSDRKDNAQMFLQNLQDQKCTIQHSFQELFDTMEKLGEGAQSVVRRIVERSTDRQYAAKIIRNVDAEKIINIKHQYKLLKALNFPTIVKAYYLFISQQESLCRLVLEYCAWRQLKAELNECGRFNEQLTAQIIKTLLQTVEYLHSCGVCHRDIKPQNILFSMMDTPSLKLIDFEISKLNKGSTVEMWTATGSLFYKAPEMFCGSYDRMVDIWAIGIVAYELLHSHPPFIKDYVDETIQDICNTDIENYIRPDLSTFAQEFLKKCLNKNPAGRLTAKSALKQPFILQACNTSVTPKEDKLNSSFGEVQCESNGFTIKQQPSAMERYNIWIKRASLQMQFDTQSQCFLDHQFGIKVISKSPNK